MKTVITKDGKLATQISLQELRNIKKKFEELHNKNNKSLFDILSEIIEKDKKQNKKPL